MKKRFTSIMMVIMLLLVFIPFGALATAEGETPADPYTFTIYHNYDYQTIYEWGSDAISKYWQEKFNLNIEQQKPDADADAKLNLMVSSGDYPEVIRMNYGPLYKQLCEMGIFMDLTPLKENNPEYDNTIAENTQELLKIDGKIYSMSHWVRKEPTGGNNVWMYNKRLYEAAGSPELKTFEDLYAYAKKVKDEVKETQEGLPVIPFATNNNNDAYDLATSAFYRAYGGPDKGASFTAHIDGKMQSVLRDPRFKAAVMELNKWSREGLLLDSQFADTNDQMVEKFISGRTGLIWYDFSMDSVNRFRQILRETHPDDDYVILTDPVYPGAEGAKTYADIKSTMGSAANLITNKAEQPQRIFDFFMHMYSKQGSIEMMYGPAGAGLWEELDENGNPIMLKSDTELTSDEKTAMGLWAWSICNSADNVDTTKFAVNDALPEEKQDWVVWHQAHVLSPIMFTSDEYVNLNLEIDQLSDLGIQRTLCEEQYRAEIPKIIMAGTAEEAEQLYDDLLKFFDDNNFAEVEQIYDARHQEILKLQGGSGYAESDK